KSGSCGLTHTAGSSEKVGVMEGSGLDCVRERANNRLLADDLIECLGPEPESDDAGFIHLFNMSGPVCPARYVRPGMSGLVARIWKALIARSASPSASVA